MARNPAAIWDHLPSSSAGAFTGGPKKAVAHKVQGDSYAGARATYRARSLGPHFTIGEEAGDQTKLYQHLDTDEASSAIANDSGGVQTNRDGAIQVEIVGWSGRSMGPGQTRRFIELQRWLHAAEGIPPVWPAGRPPKTADEGYGENNGHRDARLWDTTTGWYGHSQVPENEHWDPAWTDDEWDAITSSSTTPDPQEDDDMIPLIKNPYNGRVYALVQGRLIHIAGPAGLPPKDRTFAWHPDVKTMDNIAEAFGPAVE